MLLRHATHRRNLPNIQRQGLLCSKSRGRLKVVWLHAESKSTWAMLHTVKRHGGRVQDVAIIEVEIPRKWLRRARKRLWYTAQDVPPVHFRRLIGFAELAGPSIDDARSNAPSLARLYSRHCSSNRYISGETSTGRCAAVRLISLQTLSRL